MSCPFCNRYLVPGYITICASFCRRKQCIDCWRYDLCTQEAYDARIARGNECNSCAREWLEGP